MESKAKRKIAGKWNEVSKLEFCLRSIPHLGACSQDNRIRENEPAKLNKLFETFYAAYVAKKKKKNLTAGICGY